MATATVNFDSMSLDELKKFAKTCNILIPSGPKSEIVYFLNMKLFKNRNEGNEGNEGNRGSAQEEQKSGKLKRIPEIDFQYFKKMFSFLEGSEKAFSEFEDDDDFVYYIYENNSPQIKDDYMIENYVLLFRAMDDYRDQGKWSFKSENPLYLSLGAVDYEDYNGAQGYDDIPLDDITKMSRSQRKGYITDCIKDAGDEDSEDDEEDYCDYEKVYRDELNAVNWDDIDDIFLITKKYGPPAFGFHQSHSEICHECDFCFRKGGKCNRPPVGDKTKIYEVLGKYQVQFAFRDAIDWQVRKNSKHCKWSLRLWEECDSIEGFFDLLDKVRVCDNSKYSFKETKQTVLNQLQ